MTEISKTSGDLENLELNQFLLALGTAPLVAMLVGFALGIISELLLWPFGLEGSGLLIGFISAFAVIFGFVPYFALGGPVLWFVHRHIRPHPITSALTALAVNTVTFVGLDLVNFGFFTDAQFFLSFGSFFAPLWGGTFAILYRRYTRKPAANEEVDP